jgi:hypothetical protein
MNTHCVTLTHSPPLPLSHHHRPRPTQPGHATNGRVHRDGEDGVRCRWVRYETRACHVAAAAMVVVVVMVGGGGGGAVVMVVVVTGVGV